MSSADQVNFGSPPVIEVSIGVSFAPIDGWLAPHSGLFWNLIRTDFPECRVQPPLAQEIEAFEKPTVPGGPRMVFGVPSLEPEFRCWYIGRDGHDLVQLQHDRFLYNWRQLQEDAEYPRYADAIRPRFQGLWWTFLTFLQQEALPLPEVTQCEVSYYNHIVKGRGWDGTQDLSKVLKAIGTTAAGSFLPAAETLRINLTYQMPHKSGRLRVTAHPALRSQDGEEVLVLNLTARGKPASSDVADVMTWLDEGRRWVTRGFVDLTTPAMHKLWGYKS